MDNVRQPVAEWMRRLNRTARRRGFRVESMGQAHGFALPVWHKSAEGRPRIYLSAGIHGDEPAGPLAVERLLEEDSFDRRFAWTVCPLLNPGGLALNRRPNPDGIDLNRDYLAQISPEVRAHAAWLRGAAPHQLHLSLHEDWEAAGFYLYEINTTGRAVSFCAGILRAVGELIPIEPNNCIDDHMVAAPGYINHPPEPDDPRGWPEAIFHAKLCPQWSYTMETPSSLPLERRIAALAAGVRAAANFHFDESMFQDAGFPP